MGRKACEKGDSPVAPAFQLTMKGEESRLELRIRHSSPGVKKSVGFQRTEVYQGKEYYKILTLGT